jgi:argininosuccinate lyase
MTKKSKIPKILVIVSLSLASHAAHAADTRDTACRTTAECQAEADKLRGLSAKDATSARAKAHDQFYWLGRINMATTVMTVEEGVVPRQLSRQIAEGVAHSITQAEQPGGKRPTAVLQIERIISDKAGPEATLIHAGRSRQDMLAAVRAMRMRDEVLDTAGALLAARKDMLEIASRNVETIIPAYTNGVQAQPISYAHYLLAFADSFARDSQRIRELYARLNLSPMGTAVLANSAWPLNRNRLAELLGFDRLVINSYDAGQVITYDVPIEAAGIASSMAIRVGAMMADVHTQYHQTRPWLLLGTGSTYTSSAMPQKQNPGVIMGVRGKASDVVAAANWVTMRAHNVSPGMTDYKNAWETPRTFVLTVEMLSQFASVLKELQIDPKRALEELNGDWTTSSELADTLQRVNQIPFRVGHHFASAVVTHAKEKNLKPAEFPYAHAVQLYAESLGTFSLPASRFPLDEAAFRATLSAENMVRTRVGIGGPQPAEVRRMLGLAREALAADSVWLDERNAKLVEAQAKLNQSFQKLLGN